MSMDGYAKYQQNQLMTASPSKLLLMAYDGAIRFCKIAAKAIEEKNFEEQNTYINKATAIVCELIATLKDEVDPEFCSRMRSIYVFVIEKLGYANINQNLEDINIAIKILSDLRESWAEAERRLQQQSAQPLQKEVAA